MVIFSFVPFEKQVVIDVVSHRPCAHASGLIGVEMPAIPLIFLDRFTDIFVVLHFDTCVFFQFDITSFRQIVLNHS